MKIWKPEEIKWRDEGNDTFVSEPLVMASNAGWYIGEIYKESDGFVMPYDRLSNYHSTPEEVAQLIEELGWN